MYTLLASKRVHQGSPEQAHRHLFDLVAVHEKKSTPACRKKATARGHELRRYWFRMRHEPNHTAPREAELIFGSLSKFFVCRVKFGKTGRSAMCIAYPALRSYLSSHGGLESRKCISSPPACATTHHDGAVVEVVCPPLLLSYCFMPYQMIVLHMRKNIKFSRLCFRRSVMIVAFVSVRGLNNLYQCNPTRDFSPRLDQAEVLG